MHSLYLALHYVRYHRIKSAMIVLALAIILYLPVSLNLLVRAAEQQLMVRVESTPLVLGPRGSALDLVVHALYFQDREDRPIPYGTVKALQSENDGLAIPLYSRFQAQGYPIIGTNLDYFSYRQLQVQQGHGLSLLGECVLGAQVAAQLGLGVGDTLTSSPENVFDLAGAYPLRMQVVGVLAPADSPDDDAVFVDLKTAWILAGLIHGHDALNEETDEDLLLEKGENQVTANAKVEQFIEISEANRNSFHFHGSGKDFPISAVLFAPTNQKAHDLALGRYQSHETLQLVTPRHVIQELLQALFRVRDFVSAGYVLVLLATVLLLVLIVALSLRLREGEMRTMMELGCARSTLFRLVTAELAILVLAALLLAGVLVAMTIQFAPQVLALFW